MNLFVCTVFGTRAGVCCEGVSVQVCVCQYWQQAEAAYRVLIINGIFPQSLIFCIIIYITFYLYYLFHKSNLLPMGRELVGCKLFLVIVYTNQIPVKRQPKPLQL